MNSLSGMSNHAKNTTIDMKSFNTKLKFGALLIVLSGAFYYLTNFAPSSNSMTSVKQMPNRDETSEAQQSSEASFILNTDTNSPDKPINDPFKEFNDKKEKGQPTVVENTKPTYPPGFDPFKAKLEEQKNEAHSAVSPFSK